LAGTGGVMASEDTTSISKGCFLFNSKIPSKREGSNRKVQRKRSRRKSTQYFTGNKFPLLKGENEEHAVLRYSCFKECWTTMSERIEGIQVATNQKVFDDLVLFIKSSYTSKDSNLVGRAIPTAALLTGVNMPDHDLIFQQITSNIEKDVSPHIALLHSKDCSSLKLLLREVLTQLMSTEDQDEEVLDKSCIEVLGKLKHYTLGALKAWFMKNSEGDAEKSPVVIIFEDFEGFQKTLLQDFILICSEYIKDLPIVLVFSLATTLSAVHNVLPQAVSTRLHIEVFHAEPSLQCLHEILNKVFLTSQHPFKLGPKMLHVLYDKFLCQDFSINGFSSAIQFAMLEHFYENQLSILCSYDKEGRYALVDNLTESQISSLLNIQSYQRFRERKSLSDQKRLTRDIPFIKKIAKIMLRDLERVISNLFPMLNCLHLLSSKLPGAPFGKRFKDSYELCLKHEITKTENYHKSITLLRQISRDELLLFVRESRDILEYAIENDDLSECFVEDVSALEALIERFNTLDEPQNQTGDDAHATSSKPPSKMQIYKNRFELQERMRQAIKAKKETPYDKLRNDIADFWDKLFRKYIQCPMLLPLHEIFFFDSISIITPHLNPSPRLAVQNALRRPYDYLQCKCCNIDVDDNQDTLPDLSIVYKIHLECGKMINLYDWLQAFVSIVDPCPTSRKNSKKRKAEDENLQTRFLHSVSEMQMLGLIKPTKRKTDHVQRLTWGF